VITPSPEGDGFFSGDACGIPLRYRPPARSGPASLAAGGPLPIRLTTVRGRSGERSGSSASNPRVRPTEVGLRLTGAKALDAGNTRSVLEIISGRKRRFLLATPEGGDSPVA
jgi:hypothetical protein